MPKKSTANQAATKKDIHELRNEFKKTEKTLRTDSLKLEERLENLEGGQKRIEATVNRTANTLDAFLGKTDISKPIMKLARIKQEIFGYKLITTRKEYQGLKPLDNL